MTKEFEARFDLRVDADLKERFQKYCQSKNIKMSDAGRESLATYIDSRTFIYTLIENLQNTQFFDKFTTFYEDLPADIKKALERIIGPEEEKLVKETPPQLLKNVKVMTKQGQKVLRKLL